MPREYKYISPEQKKAQEKMIFIGGGLALLVISLIGVWFLLQMPPEPPGPELPTLNITPTPQNETEECKTDDCLVELAWNEQNPTICELVDNETLQQDCFESLARIYFTACERVIDYEEKRECAFAHARKENSIRPCQRLGLENGDKRACILTIDSCYFEDEEEQPTCRALAWDDVSYCGHEPECVTTYANSTQNFTSCGEIEGLPNQYACVSLAKGESVCGELAGEFQIDYCHELYAKQSYQSSECAEIRPATEYEWRCFAYFAINEGDYEICDDVDLRERWTCYKNYSVETNDVNGCIAISEYAPTAKATCYFDLAMIYGNPEVCEEITDDAAQKGRCYSAAIYNPAQPIPLENCHDVSDASWKNSCYGEVAKHTGDESICNIYIREEGERQLCIIRAQNMTIIVEDDTVVES